MIGDGSSSLLVDTASITGNVSRQRNSSMSLRGGTVTDNVTLRAGGGIDAGDGGSITGNLSCEIFSGTYIDVFPQSASIAESFTIDYGAFTPGPSDFYCGYVFP